jgi:MFS superfamily sulfate permease-like transporter
LRLLVCCSAQTPWFGFPALAVLLLLNRVPGFPSAPVVLIGAALAGWLTNGAPAVHPVAFGLSVPRLVIPTWPDIWEGFTVAVIPQMTLTLTNAVVVTAALARDLFPNRGAIASERNLSLSSGLINVLLCPFGAMPMCHGAGGLQAQYRFGARTGLAPVMFGTFLLVLAVGFADNAASFFTVIPIGAVGALLIFAGTDLAFSRRLFDARPSCWPVIAASTIATLALNPAVGLVIGWIVELIRTSILRARLRTSN